MKRRFLALLCTAQLVAGYHMRATFDRFAFDQLAMAESESQAKKRPLQISEYLRTVYKMSHESAIEPEDRRQKFLESNPQLAELAKHIESDASDVESRLTLADAFGREGLAWSAFRLFKEVENLTGGDFRSALGLARIWDTWQEYTMASAEIRDALAANPASAEAWEVKGAIALHSNAPAEAIEAFKTSLEFDAEQPITIANLGYAYILIGDLNEARIWIEKALTLDPSLVEARNNLGIALARSGDYDGALSEMEKVAGQEVALNNLGAILLSEKKAAEAAEKFQEAIKYAPNYIKAHENLAEAQAMLAPPTIVDLPPFEDGAAKTTDLRPADPVAAQTSDETKAEETTAPETEQETAQEILQQAPGDDSVEAVAMTSAVSETRAAAPAVRQEPVPSTSTPAEPQRAQAKRGILLFERNTFVYGVLPFLSMIVLTVFRRRRI